MGSGVPETPPQIGTGGLPDVAVLGLGRAGTDLVHLLRGAGATVVLAWRRGRGPDRIADVETVSGDLPTSIPADVILLATPDRAIAPLARRLADGDLVGRDAAVLHLSGALPASALAQAGLTAACGAMHPLQTLLGDGRPRRPFSWVLEGDDAALRAAAALVGAMGCDHVRMDPESKHRYHAAATLVSNHVVALARAAEAQLSRAGIPEQRLPDLFLPLLEGSVRNIGRVGTRDALTGPVVRGDVETVAAHLDALGDAPEALDIYRAASASLIPAAEEAGLPPEIAARLRDLLDSD